MQTIDLPRQRGMHAVHREHVLREVVRPDGEEIDFLRQLAAMSAADGTSIMIPISTGGTPSSARTFSAISFAARKSESEVIIGNIILTGPVVEAR